MSLPDLTTADAVKTYAGLDGSSDEALASLIPAYSAWVRSWLNRDITSQQYDVRRSGRCTVAMQLPQYPITAVSLLEIDGRAIPASPVFGQAGFIFDEEQIVLTGYGFSRGTLNVRIVWTAGYDVVPADLSQAVAEIVALRMKQSTQIGWRSKGLAAESITLDVSAMPASVSTVLGSYQRIAPI